MDFQRNRNVLDGVEAGPEALLQLLDPKSPIISWLTPPQSSMDATLEVCQASSSIAWPENEAGHKLIKQQPSGLAPWSLVVRPQSSYDPPELY